jgi:hypothetical protein
VTVEQKSGPFGGLSASEAAKRSAEVRKRNKAERAEGSNPSPQSNAEIERNLRVIAMGHGAPAGSQANQAPLDSPSPGEVPGGRDSARESRPGSFAGPVCGPRGCIRSSRETERSQPHATFGDVRLRHVLKEDNSRAS